MAITRYVVKLLCVVALLVLSITLLLSDGLSRKCPKCDSEDDIRSRDETFRTDPFQADITGCTVKLITDENELNNYLANKGNVPSCSMEYFNNYIQENQQFLGKGVWFAPHNGTPSVEADFYPEGCTFTHKLTSAGALESCF